MRRALVLPVLVVVLAAGCGGDGSGDGTFAYDEGQPLALQTGSRTDRNGVAVQEVSYASGADRVAGYLVTPPATGRRLPAVVFLHGSGGDRSEQLDAAVRLAKRGAVALTITAPSGAKTAPQDVPVEDAVRWQGDIVIQDVVAVRRALDLLASDRRVDGNRLGLVGWSMGGRLGALTAGVDDRLRATVLMSAGALPVSEYVDAAPAELQDVVRQVLEPVDPIARIRDAHGALFLQDGRQDSVVPAQALQEIVDAAPEGTRVRWYPADHALNARAESDRLAWLADELGIGSAG